MAGYTDLRGTDKITELHEANQRKLDALAGAGDLIRQKQAQVAAASGRSVVSELELDPDSVIGRATNLTASAATGGARVTGQVMSLPSSIGAQWKEQGLTEQDYQDFSAYQRGEATEEQKQRLFTKRSFGPQGDPNQKEVPLPTDEHAREAELARRAIFAARSKPKGVTQAAPIDRFTDAGQLREVARDINNVFDTSSIVHQGARMEMSEDLKKNFGTNWDKVKNGKATDKIAGMAGLISDAVAAGINNPQAVAEYATENIPQLALGAGTGGAAALGVSNIGYAMDNYQKGIEEYQKNNNGAMPDAKTRNEMAMWAASTALAEQVGDVVGVGGAKALKEAVSAAKKVGVDVGTEGAKNALKAALRVPGATAEGAIVEAGTEGFQTYAEGKAALKDATPEQIYEGAAIGGMVGGVLKGAPTAAAQVVEGATSFGSEVSAKKAEADAKNEVLKQATESGDISGLVDPNKRSYSPDVAVQALFNQSQKEGTTEKQKTEHLNQATNIVAGIDEQIALSKQDMEDTSPEQVAKYKERLNSPNLSDEQRDALTDIIKTAPAEYKAAEARLASLNAQRTQAHEALSNFTRESNPKDVDVGAEIESFRNAATPEAAQESVKKVISLAMRDSSTLDGNVAAQLASDESNALTPDQRTYLRAFSEARIAENMLSDMGKVSREVLVGSDKNVGIAQYRQRMQAAVASGNEAVASRQIQNLEGFQADHQMKASAAQEALNEGPGTQIIRNTDGSWEMNTGEPLSQKALRANGGLAINSPRLVQQIQQEADALSKAANELNAVFNINFRNKGQSNVQNQAQPQASKEGILPSGSDAQETKVAPVQPQAGKADAGGRPAKVTQPSATNEAVAETKPSKESKLDQRLHDIVVGESYGSLKDPAAVIAFAKTAKEAIKRIGSIKEEDRTEQQMDLLWKLRQNFKKGDVEFDWQMLFDGMNPTEAQVAELDQITGNAQKTQEAPASPVATTETTTVDSQKDVKSSVSQVTEKATTDERSVVEPERQEDVAGKQLDVFNLEREAEKAKPFQKQNLVATLLTQAKNKVLGKKKDFISNAGTLAEELPGQEITEAQESAFTFLKEKVKEWGPLLSANILMSEKDRDFFYRNPVQFLFNADGTMEENIQTSMVMGVIDYVTQFGSRSLFNDWADINTILHRPEETQVTPAEAALLREVGVQAVVVTGSIGSLASRVLGLKRDGNTPMNFLAKVEAGLGAHIVDLMINRGILVENIVTGAELNQAMEMNEGDKGAYNPKVKYTFYRLAMNQDGEFAPAVKEIFDQARNAKGAFTDLFGTEVGVIAPSFKLRDFKQSKIKGTDRGIPQPLKDAQDKLQKTPFLIKKVHWDLVNALPEGVLAAIAGAEEITDATQASRKKGIQTSNDGIKKGIANLKSFVTDYLENDLDKPWFIEPLVWVNQRVGVKTQLVDPQANKVHRYLSKMGSWNTKIDLNNEAEVNNFKLRVMEGLGDKTDETANAQTLQRFDSLVSQPAIAAAVEAIHKRLQGMELTAEDGAAIQAGVAKGGEAMHSFDALVALAQYAEAKAQKALTGKSTFNVEMSVEDDGKTNGPMLSMLLFGAAWSMDILKEAMARGGFYDQQSGLSQYSQWRSMPGNEDLYQSTMRIFNATLSKIAAEEGKDSTYAAKVAAIYSFTGNLMDDSKNVVTKAGRNIVKTPLQAIFFGSSSKRSAESMADKMIEGIFDRIQKLPDNTDDRVPLIRDLNTLGLKVSEDTTIETLMGAELSRSEIRTLTNTFMQYVGDHVKEAVDSHFKPFMDAKQKMNAAANLTFNLYNSTFTAMRDQKLKELVEAGEMEVGKTGKPIFDLTPNQEKEIKETLNAIFPQMHSWMSQRDGDINTGLRMAKEDKSLSDRDMYKTEVKTKAGVHRVTSQEKSMAEPGVSMLSASVHSFDSGISHLAGMSVDSLNNHDARTTGVNELLGLGTSLNKATWDGLVEYSPLGATADALGRVVVGLSKMIEEGTLPQEAIDKLVLDFGEVATKKGSSLQEYIDKVLAEVRYEQGRADAMKLEFLSDLAAVDQYPVEGGNYVVTDADRQAAKDKLATVQTGMTAEENAAIDTLFKAFAKKAEKKEERKAPTKPEPAQPETSPFGELGTSRRAPDGELMTFLEQNPKLTVAQLVPFLYKQIEATEQSGYRDFTLKLLKMLRKSVDPKMPVKYITKMTPVSASIHAMPGAAAWFTTTGAESEIAILSPDFKNSTLRLSTLVHELVHASVFQTMETERNKKQANPKYTSEVLDLESDLNQLLDKARELVKANGLTQHERAVANVDEMIAYGMMSPNFQQDVLAKINFNKKDLKTGKSSLVNGLREFIKNITEILFGKNAPQNDRRSQIDGMSLLIANTTAIMSQSAADLSSSSQASTPATGPSGQPTSMPSKIGASTRINKALSVLDLAEKKAAKSGLDSIDPNVPVPQYLLDAEAALKEAIGNELEKMSSYKTNAVNRFQERFEEISNSQLEPEFLVELGKEISIYLDEYLDSQGDLFTGKSLAMFGDPMSQVENLDTTGIYDALSEGVSRHAPEFNARVKGLLNTVVSKLYGPFGSFKDRIARGQASDALDVMIKAIQTGNAPFVADIIGSPFRASQQEAFVMEQIEATVRAAIEGGETSSTSLAYNQLVKLYREAYQRIKPEDFHNGDWSTATANEKANAQAQYDFIFGIKSGIDGKAAYLSRFAALGLGHEQFNKMLNFNTAQNKDAGASGLSVADRLQRYLEKVLGFFSTRVMHTFAGQKADQKLETLVGHLVDIEAKRRLSIAKNHTGFMSTVEGKAKELSNWTRSKVDEIAGSKAIREHASGYVRGAGAFARTIAGDRVEKMFDGLARLHNESVKSRQSFARDMLTEVRGLPQRMMKALLDAKRTNEQMRQDVIASTEKTVLGMFKDKGANLTIAQREGVTQALLRTGAHVLMKGGRYTMADITNIVGDKAVRDQAIKDVEGELAKVALPVGGANFFAYYTEKANVLGHYKATGHVRRARMMMNAHNIANLAGTPQAKKVSQAMATQAEPLIEALVALYAIDYTNSVDLGHATNVMRDEATRPDGNNGVEFLLLSQARFEKESLNKLFNDNPALMVHGYTPELLNSQTEMKIANDYEGKKLELQGWKKVGAVTRDPSDPKGNENQSMYVLKGAGLQPYQSGAMSLTDMAAKGSKLHSGFLNPKTDTGLANLTNLLAMAQDTAASDDALLNAGPKYKRQNLSNNKSSYMAPIVNEKGDITNFRYLMNEHVKDTMLERDSRFEKVMGALAGSIYDKENSRQSNVKVLEALKEEYDETYKEQANSFVHVGPDSLDPEIKEIWHMLPEKTKQDVKRVWGTNGMMVRLDSLNVIFGYRKHSIADMFKKDPSARNKIEQIATTMVESLFKQYARQYHGMNDVDANEYAKRAAIYVSRGEKVWQEVVKEVKDIIVIKSFGVMAGNIWSNLSFLVLHGVPLGDIAKHHKVAMQGATAYQADNQQLAQLKAIKEAGYTQGMSQDIDHEIARLEDAIARNPVKELIDAGLMPTIVDDVSLQDDPYSYKTYVSRWADKNTQWMPDTMKNLSKQLYMTKETSMYRSLSRITQLSDFVARYTLYQHLINRKDNPLSKEQAVLEANETFVNYDVPLPKGLQYTDDMGITMFTKYFLRIQRVLLKLVRENPARVLSTVAIGQFVDLGPIVLDSSWMHHLGNNPINMGALQYPFTLDELATAQAGMKLLK